jgi:hypothetical protein
MKQFACIWFAGLVMVAGPALACSPGEFTQKQKAYGDAVKVAFDRDPGGDDARRAKAMAVIDRYSGLKPGPYGGTIIDLLCKENDELLAIYK